MKEVVDILVSGFHGDTFLFNVVCFYTASVFGFILFSESVL